MEEKGNAYNINKIFPKAFLKGNEITNCSWLLTDNDSFKLIAKSDNKYCQLNVGFWPLKIVTRTG